MITDEVVRAAGVRIPVAQFVNETGIPGRVDYGMSFAPTTPGAVPSSMVRIDGQTTLPVDSTIDLDVVAVVSGPPGAEFSFTFRHAVGVVPRRPPREASAVPSRAVDRFLTITNTGSEPGEVGILGVFGKEAPAPADALADLRIMPGSSVDTYLDFTITNAPPAPHDAAIDGGFEWESITPRLGLTYALGGDRRTLLRASYSRFADQLGTGSAAALGPLGSQGYMYPTVPIYTYDTGGSHFPGDGYRAQWLQDTSGSLFGADVTVRYADVGSRVGPFDDYVSHLLETQIFGGAPTKLSATSPSGHVSELYIRDTWKRHDRLALDLGVRYDRQEDATSSQSDYWYFPNVDRTGVVDAQPAPDYLGYVNSNLFELDRSTVPEGCLPFPRLSFKEKAIGTVAVLGAVALAFFGFDFGDSVQTRTVRIGNVGANSGQRASGPGTVTAPVVPRLTAFIGGGDHPAFVIDYRSSPGFAPYFAGNFLSAGTACGSVEGVPFPASVVLNLNGPLGPTSWGGPLNAQAQFQATGGISAPGTYTVTGVNYFLPNDPNRRVPISFSSVNPVVTVPTPPAENPCNFASLPPGVPLATQSGTSSTPATPSEPTARFVRVTTETNSFPWSVPIGVGAATLTVGGMCYLNRRREDSFVSVASEYGLSRPGPSDPGPETLGH